MEWSRDAWHKLAKLREEFLKEEKTQDYWQDGELLKAYDQSFAQRIAWKWQAVLDELKLRDRRPSRSLEILDFGCGTGVATRTCLRDWGPEKAASIDLFDRSQLAAQFAKARLCDLFGEHKQVKSPEIRPLSQKTELKSHYDLVLLSHILGELSESDELALFELLKRAQALVWVEAGTHSISRRLSGLRNRLIEQGFGAVAPCTHSLSCPALHRGNERDWCHSFSHAPSEVHQDADWSRFSKEFNIDLRRLPYAFMILQREESSKSDLIFAQAGQAEASAQNESLARMIGEARQRKGFAEVLLRAEDLGETTNRQAVLREIMVQKREHKDFIKKLKKGPPSPLMKVAVNAKGQAEVARFWPPPSTGETH